MRILLLTQWFQPEPFFKGLPFAKALRARGHEVEVLTGFPNYPGGKFYPGYNLRVWLRETIDGIRVNRVVLYPSHDQSGLHRILNYLSFALACLCVGPWLVRKPDIIYVYNLITLCPMAFFFRRLLGCKVILDVQDLWPDSVIRSGMLSHVGAQHLLSAVCHWIYRRADWLTVLSPGFKLALEARGVSPDKVEVIYNWFDESAQGPTAADQRLAQELGLVGRFNVLFAGTMGLMQSLDTVLDAAKLCADSVPQAQFVLMGGGTDRLRLETKAMEMGLANVRFLSPQPPQEMRKFYALADALLVHLKNDPLFRITIPSKTQAYLFMGKPIIMAMQGDAAELVMRAGAGVICAPQDARGLSNAVLKLAGMTPEDRERLGNAGATFYAANLSMKSGVGRFEQRMQDLLSSR